MTRGYMIDRDDDEAASGRLEPWEALATEAVGTVIGFWNFKRNHGRVWALLYLRDCALSQSELQDALGLSKGAASMITRELETWGVIRRVRAPGDAPWRFEAETDLMRMIGRVLREREAELVQRVRHDLEEAERLARPGPPEVRRRLARLSALALLVDGALRTFVATARFDASGVVRVLLPNAIRDRKRPRA
ncbi:MAG: MarR family transcriptional regulator [Polyangiaceae bacterium]